MASCFGCGPPVLPLVLLLLLIHAVAQASSQALPGCQAKCGNVAIHYPFGIGEGCFHRGFRLTCNDSKPLLGGFRVQEIMITESQFRVDMPSGQYCYTSDGKPRTKINTFSANLTLSRYSFSSERNAFVVIGCDTLVRFGNPSEGFMTGCVSVCNERSRIENGTCTGLGCCQTAIPDGLKYFEGEMMTFSNYSGIRNFSRCSYAFLVEKDLFRFNTTILTTEYNYGDMRPPMILDWVIEKNTTCAEAKTNITAYGCRSSNSRCIDSEIRRGYLCNCSEGYEGNPYLENGCKDIDECQKPELYPCKGVCANMPGTYNCTCPPGTHGNNPKLENCIDDVVAAGSSLPLAVKVIIGLGSGSLFFMVVGSWAYWGCQKRRLIKLKQAFFEQNGGLFLQQQLVYHQASSFKIFSMQELRKATGNFDQRQIIGKGGHGTVYRGILEDGRVVAIKKSMMIDESKSREFAKEMLILSQINHVHVVKLLGCCLEVEVPMLVYEYIPNGTLFQFIHQKRRELFISFDARIRIATETAEALAYLHSAASPPILHGDIKSSNIILDNNFRAKVSDFGTSVLALDDKTQFTTLVQGTCGYLDPEYLQTCQLTEKSDVYSFGVVLVELLTGRKALYFGGTEEERSLAFNFVLCEGENRLLEILDPQIINEEGLSKPVLDAARVAVQCLSLKGDQRPTMKQVLVELQALCRTDSHPWVRRNPEENTSLLGDEPTPSGGYDSTRSLVMGIERHAMVESGR